VQLDVAAFCQDLLAQIQPMGESLQRQVVLVNQGNCSSLVADPQLLQPTLMNLLFNAIKYSSSGNTIYLKVACQEKT
jgi:signal transduction histidine kinase